MMAQDCLAALMVGHSAFVSGITAEPSMRRRLLELGLIPGTRVTCVTRSPAGDPAAYLIRGSVIALRARDAKGIAVVPCSQAAQGYSPAWMEAEA